MLKIVMGLSLFLGSMLLYGTPVLQSDFNTAPCFNMDEVERIGKELKTLLQHELCASKMDPKQFAFISHTTLPKIISKSYLGVEPPEHWQQATDDIIDNCLVNTNPCKKESRNQFTTCMQPRIPLLLLQFGPWLAEHCSTINTVFIKQWPNKKLILHNIINEATAKTI